MLELTQSLVCEGDATMLDQRVSVSSGPIKTSHDPSPLTSAQEAKSFHQFEFFKNETLGTHRAVTPNIQESPLQTSTYFITPSPRHSDSFSPKSRHSPDYEAQPSPGFRHALSEFEKTLASFKPDEETSRPPPTREQLVHTDSIKTEDSEGSEFFDCKQSFSDVSEPEPEAEAVKALSDIPYHIESLPGTPSFDFLSSQHYFKKGRGLVSVDHDDLELPIVLEPEETYESDEEMEKYYGYEGTVAEELPPRKGDYYDDDDEDSLGRVRACA